MLEPPFLDWMLFRSNFAKIYKSEIKKSLFSYIFILAKLLSHNEEVAVFLNFHIVKFTSHDEEVAVLLNLKNINITS